MTDAYLYLPWCNPAFLFCTGSSDVSLFSGQSLISAVPRRVVQHSPALCARTEKNSFCNTAPLLTARAVNCPVHLKNNKMPFSQELAKCFSNCQPSQASFNNCIIAYCHNNCNNPNFPPALTEVTPQKMPCRFCSKWMCSLWGHSPWCVCNWKLD